MTRTFEAFCICSRNLFLSLLPHSYALLPVSEDARGILGINAKHEADKNKFKRMQEQSGLNDSPADEEELCGH